PASRPSARIEARGRLRSAGPSHSGHGFHGVHEEDLTSSDGQTFEGTVDGRALVPFRPDGGLRALAFADGKPAPRVKEKAFVRTGLRRPARQALESPCLDDPSGGSVAVL